jgi:type VI protein secretion system component VasF
LVQQRNLNQGQIKIRILAYLYSRKEGANQHDLQSCLFWKGTGGSHFKKLLDELCRSEQVDMIDVEKDQIIYKMIGKGRKTVENLRDSLMKDFSGSSGHEN